MPSEEIELTIGSNNVFADIGHPDPEKALAKAELILRITTIIEDRGLSEEEVAKLLGISSLRKASSIWNSLCKGQLGKFTIGQLLDYLAALDEDTEIIVRDAYGPVQFRVATG
jgi:predicted XRE-type DNA-binding protein